MNPSLILLYGQFQNHKTTTLQLDIFCVGQSADLATALLNKALQKVYRWCLVNQLTPHPGKSEVMIISKKTIMGPQPALLLRDSALHCVAKT